MKRRYAILLDGGFITKRLGVGSRRFPTPDEVLGECERIAAHPELQHLVLLRIYYYDSPPTSSTVTNPLSGKSTCLRDSSTFAVRTRFLDELELKPNVALRKGELVVHGWRVRSRALNEIAHSPRSLAPDDLELNMEQKGVDLRIGLDIARLALCHLVDTLVVVTGDSDMVPAFKFARREGVRVILDYMGGSVKRELKAHADVVL